MTSGLGFSICLRLIDEFVATQLGPLSLHLIITTRDEAKSRDTVSTLSEHLSRKSKPLRRDRRKHVSIHSIQVDLTSLHSVLALSENLLASLPRLDVILLNAGYGGYTGINWPRAIWTILTDFPYSVTYPTFAIAGVGDTTKRQIPSEPEEPALGQVFCSNVFGHYMLVSYLAPLFDRALDASKGNLAARRGRIIWISSLEAYASSFSIDDIQGISAANAYKSSKRLTDILALTSSLPSCNREVRRLLQIEQSRNEPPKIYLAQPGICATSFVPLHPILYHLMTLAFYLARLLGSPWHTVSSYKGACAPVWLSLAPQEELDALEEADGAGKWGSCVNAAGNERVTRTEVEGWGLRGKVEPLGGFGHTRRWRRRDVGGLTEKEREGFELLGRECWGEMNRLNEDWRRRLAIGQKEEEEEE